MTATIKTISLALGAVLGLATSAYADRISHPTASFAGLDKITGRIINFDVAAGETVQFGSLQITARVCFTRPATEAPQTDVFAEVDEIAEKNAYKRIFSGWMFAASPGLHGIEHPVYDIWLIDCKGGAKITKTAPEVAETPLEPLPDLSAAPDSGAAVAAKPAAAAQRRHKPRPAPPNVIDAGGALDLGTVPDLPAPVQAPRPKPARRFFPTDAPPIPPADIAQ